MILTSGDYKFEKSRLSVETYPEVALQPFKESHKEC